MRWITYKFATSESADAFIEKSVQYSDANLQLAKQEAHNGKYTIVDDGEPAPPPTAEERLAALESALLEMMGVSIDG